MNEMEVKNGTTEIEKTDENITEKSKKISPFCRSDCKVCNSKLVLEIHDGIQMGVKYMDICADLLKTHNFSISPASLSRHWKNYKKNKQARAIEIQRFENEADDLSRHQKQVTTVADAMFEMLAEKIENRTLPVSIADYASLVKIRHSVLSGDGNALNDLVGIFQQATDKYGVNLKQGILFKKNDE
jgi:hypothetical protein